MIHDNIKSLREQLGLTQTEFGALCGLSKMSVCHYEKGRSTPSKKAANRIVRAMTDRGILIGLEYLLREDI